ncbi:MAG: putative repeat protein (TIGR03806 family) [Saprospiraceae bacterium]|jgi:uncharacterized repeat protein (TIGR03806 family)
MQLIRKIVLLSLITFIFSQCTKDEQPTIVVSKVNTPEGKGFDLLSEYNFFEGNLADLIPNTAARVLPYDLNTALFSDYASKKRFIYVPEDSSIPFDTSGVLDLPEGSILIKHFYFALPDGSEKYMETRLLIRKAEEWQPEIYEWNSDKTDAERTVVGGTRNLSISLNGQERNFNYLIPNQNQCKNCHDFDGEIKPIGPNIPNLNKDYNYSTGSADQLTTWINRGLLTAPSNSEIPKWHAIDDTNASLNSRARAYLAVNCSSCHRLEGSAANSGLYLEYLSQDSSSLGFWKTPVAAGDGSGGLTYVITPGDADQSILLYRMIADAVDERMPEIGRELLHDEGIQLIRDWINEQ